MQLFGDLFENNRLLAAVIVVVIVLAIAALALVVYRLVSSRRVSTSGNSRSRQPRLGVVDSFDLDRQRQLVIIRRDNVEHLLLIGGPNDVVVEAAIMRGTGAASASVPGRDKEPGPLVSPPTIPAPTLPAPTPQPGPVPAPVLHPAPVPPPASDAPVLPAPPVPPRPPVEQPPTAQRPGNPVPAAPRPPSPFVPRPSTLPGGPGGGAPPKPTPFTPRPASSPLRPLTTAPRPAPPPPLAASRGGEGRTSDDQQRADPAPSIDTETPLARTPPAISLEPVGSGVKEAALAGVTRNEPPIEPGTPRPPNPALLRPAPAKAGMANRSLEALETLEEEMAKLLGRPVPPADKS